MGQSNTEWWITSCLKTYKGSHRTGIKLSIYKNEIVDQSNIEWWIISYWLKWTVYIVFVPISLSNILYLLVRELRINCLNNFSFSCYLPYCRVSVTVHSVADLWTTCLRYWKQPFWNSHDVLYEVMFALLVCVSGSSGLHDKQDLKVLIKAGSSVINSVKWGYFFIYKTNVCTQIYMKIQHFLPHVSAATLHHQGVKIDLFKT